MVTRDCMGCVFSDDIVYYNPIMVCVFSKSDSESKCFSTDFVTPIWKDNRRLETMSESAPSLLEIAFGLELKVTSYAGVAHNLQRFSYPPVIKRGWEIAEWNGVFFLAEKTIELNGWRVHGNPIIVMVYKLGTMIKMIQIWSTIFKDIIQLYPHVSQ